MTDNFFSNGLGSGFSKGGFTLDVGCGFDPRGSVNVDLCIRADLGQSGVSPPPKIPNFIKATAENLPFKTGSFDLVISRQVIEHLKKPLKALEEMYRVAPRIVIETYHYMGERLILGRKKRAWFKQRHISKMSFTWLRRASRILGLSVRHEYILTWNYFPSRFFPLFQAPGEIRVLICQ